MVEKARSEVWGPESKLVDGNEIIGVEKYTGESAQCKQ